MMMMMMMNDDDDNDKYTYKDQEYNKMLIEKVMESNFINNLKKVLKKSDKFTRVPVGGKIENLKNQKNLKNCVKNLENRVWGDFPIKNLEEKRDNCLICFHIIR